MIVCPEHRFGGEKETTDIIGINNGKYFCPENWNLTLKGRLASKIAKTVSLTVNRCN